MSLEDRGAQHDKVPVDKYHNPNADYEMTTRDYVLRPSADEDSGPITITLPPVAEAKGRFYAILSRDADAINTITIEDNNDDSECWANDIAMDSACERILAYSDGLAWFVAYSTGFPQADTTYPPGTTNVPSTAATTEPGGSQTTAAPTTAAPTSAAPTTAA